MNRKRGQMQSYFAGIIDGEGCIGIFEANGTYQARVTVQMDNPDAVMLLWSYYPEGKVSYRNGSWTVTYTQFRGYDLLEDIKEFLIVKHEQAKVALSFIVHRRREHQVPVKGGCGRCFELCNSLRKIREENKRVKTVDAHLEHEMRQYRAKREEVAQDVQVMNGKMRELLEGVETRVSESNKPMSAREQDIVHSQT